MRKRTTLWVTYLAPPGALDHIRSALGRAGCNLKDDAAETNTDLGYFQVTWNGKGVWCGSAPHQSRVQILLEVPRRGHHVAALVDRVITSVGAEPVGGAWSFDRLYVGPNEARHIVLSIGRGAPEMRTLNMAEAFSSSEFPAIETVLDGIKVWIESGPACGDTGPCCYLSVELRTRVRPHSTEHAWLLTQLDQRLKRAELRLVASNVAGDMPVPR